ncbi:hypothetical protein ACQEVX_30440 [Streptomyces syringium]|uniref:hypothetical protein n=1 Tax=Streptomyces syringium TaxID=76729 RepID=UPI003D8E09EF
MNLLATIGALVCKIVERGIGAYYHLVVSNLVTEECEQDIHEAFCEEGFDWWRESVIEITHRPRPNFHFPGSTESTLYVIHPEASR